MPATLSKIMRSKIPFFLIWINLLGSGCYKNYLYVRQEWIDRAHLASSYVGTPDPRQADPPLGQQLFISWDFPRSIFEKHLQLIITVRLWDCTQTTVIRPILRKRDYEVFFFPNDKSELDKKILTYQVQAVSEKGEVVGYWEHPFWTKLINVGREESFSFAK